MRITQEILHRIKDWELLDLNFQNYLWKDIVLGGRKWFLATTSISILFIRIFRVQLQSLGT